VSCQANRSGQENEVDVHGSIRYTFNRKTTAGGWWETVEINSDSISNDRSSDSKNEQLKA
jgi:hypothetical protein